MYAGAITKKKRRLPNGVRFPILRKEELKFIFFAYVDVPIL